MLQTSTKTLVYRATIFVMSVIVLWLYLTAPSESQRGTVIYIVPSSAIIDQNSELYDRELQIIVNGFSNRIDELERGQ